MNSYPHEFLAHHVPLMFVAGLEGGVNSSGSNTPSKGSNSTSSVQDSAVPTSDDGGTAIASGQGSEQSSPFKDLQSALRYLFAGQGEKGKLWLKDHDKELFRILLVDKATRIPPRKVTPATSASGIQAVSISIPHSALSPLSLHSPVYPDGLISPMWVRKHADIVPSVFVLFLHLPDFGLRKGRSRSGSTVSSGSKTPRSRAGSIANMMMSSPDIAHEQGMTTSVSSESTNSIMDDTTRQALQTQADEKLIKEIAERKKKTADRGIKLTVVLLAGREMLDDPGLDSRLSMIRRQSGLDSRASLFVLTPVGNDELAEFAASLQESLYEPALEYYANHYKRNRRKRAKLPANPSLPPYPTGPLPQGAKPLSTQGWAVRYDYKAGVLAEMRGETDVARKHWEDSWHELVALFTSPVALPARTKRWAEAKVLADCIAVKVCRLHLYHAEAAAASAFFRQHLARFSEFSRSWGIGEETFEYWSWMARQYRIFAELLELAIAAGLRISLPLPTFSPALVSATPSDQDLLTSTVNPVEVLHHPGYYWYMAGSCNVRRRDSFRAASLKSDAAVPAPGFANEQKADHAAIIVELFTKAYTAFKGQQTVQTRMSLFVAYKIAEAYAVAGQQELAMKFFERIGKTYKRELWRNVTWSLQALWMEAAKSTGSLETVARILWDSMAPNGTPPNDQNHDYQEELDSLLATSLPTSSDPIEIDSITSGSLFQVTAGFWEDQAIVGDTVQWRISVKAQKLAKFGQLDFDSVVVRLTGDAGTHRFSRSADATSSDKAGLESSKDQIAADLSWYPGKAIAFTGSSTLKQSGDIRIEDSFLVYKQGPWTFHLPLVLSPSAQGSHPMWTNSSVHFKRSPRNIQVDTHWATQAYCDETIRHELHVSNHDIDPLVGVLRVEIVEAAKLGSAIRINDATGTGELEVDVGKLEGGADVVLPVFLTHRALGPVTIKVSLRSGQLADASSPEPDFEWSGSHTLQSQPIFEARHQVTCRQRSPRALLDDGDDADPSWEVQVATEVQTRGNRSILLRGMRFMEAAHSGKRLLYASTADMLLDDGVMQSGDAMSLLHTFDLEDPTTIDRTYDISPITSGHIEVDWALSPGDDQPPFTTRILLPPLVHPERTNGDLEAELQAPASVDLATPFAAVLTVRNRSAGFIASGLTLQVEASEAFVWKGQRHCRLPLLLPGQRWDLHMTLIAVGSTGPQILPRLHLLASAGTETQREVAITAGKGLAQVTLDGIQVFVQP